MAKRLNRIMFNHNDPRLKYTVKEFDPRIHFALNCGASSCPPISVYTPDNVETGLESATVNFINSPETSLDLNGRQIQVSSLFKWYKSDFSENLNSDGLKVFGHQLTHGDQNLLKYIVKYFKGEKSKLDQLNTLVDQNKMTIKYNSYNWKMNIKSL